MHSLLSSPASQLRPDRAPRLLPCGWPLLPAPWCQQPLCCGRDRAPRLPCRWSPLPAPWCLQPLCNQGWVFTCKRLPLRGRDGALLPCRRLRLRLCCRDREVPCEQALLCGQTRSLEVCADVSRGFDEGQRPTRHTSRQHLEENRECIRYCIQYIGRTWKSNLPVLVPSSSS